MLALALKYRPKTFDDLAEQQAIKTILTEQVNTSTHKNAYLFVGGAGTGKTTSARIFARELNGGKGTPIEIDAASNNGVDDVRSISESAKFKSLDTTYKIFIIDECHMMSTGAWNAMLKILEEPPASTIFIFCTTDPQKIPTTVLSRVQRYDFGRISFEGIVKRLKHIISCENAEVAEETQVDEDVYIITDECYEYIAKLADGGMRDAITYLDKCLSFSYILNLTKVVEALGTVNYEIMFSLLDTILECDRTSLIQLIEDIHKKGVNLKYFMEQFSIFLVDLLKYSLTQKYDYTQIPSIFLINYSAEDFKIISELLQVTIKLNANIKWAQNPKALIEAEFLVF